MGSTPDIPSQMLHKKLQRSHSLTMDETVGGGGDEPTANTSTDDSLKPLMRQDMDEASDGTNQELEDNESAVGIKLQMSCEMCKNYEIQLQEMQYNEVVTSLQLENCEKTIKGLREELRKEQTFRSDLEEKFNEDAKRADKEIRDLCGRVDESYRTIDALTKSHHELRKEANDIIANLMTQMEEASKESNRIQADNNVLLGKFVAKSQVLQNEAIDLPQDIDEMQFYCLKLREELITTLAAKERNEETMKSEIMFLKDQMIGEQQSKETIEENLTQDNDMLRSTVDSLQTEFNDIKRRYEEQEQQLFQCSDRLSRLTDKTHTKISELEVQNNDLSSSKTKLESDNSDLRNQVQSLQVELDNSEAVQKDFVKLSQSLQIQLEKIRQSDSEVRWQHEDDIVECNSCKKAFHSKKEKSHCCHCGRVFCSECNNKVIYSGPKGRPFKVCGVCHTLLDNQTACWFVNEAPQSPT
ncbi:unnamed protein product [Medioppia subpectinata]|uniref:FYVE-type domain-containing protein n=1 Tax=Medioppia subpectinata TaxID=1979941 RepID=A0A7R9L2H4_9ACAR|nr:unnamed protein product [Medioppia subpectinata]CAG2113191.1 unnamed protein product [Medioppia subpectinata]